MFRFDFRDDLEKQFKQINYALLLVISTRDKILENTVIQRDKIENTIIDNFTKKQRTKKIISDMKFKLNADTFCCLKSLFFLYF